MDSSFLSFRDPSGGLFQKNEKLFRYIRAEYAEDTLDIFNSETIKNWTDQGKFVSAKKISREDLKDILSQNSFSLADVDLVLEHEKVFFPSYPYEWSSFMLYDAGRFTLDLASSLLKEGRGLKDATPYNILFDGCNPVFIDLTSVEKREEKDPIWLAYAQFLKMFFMPLLLNKYANVPLSDIFLSRLDGIELEEAMGYISSFKLFKPFVFFSLFLPYMLSRKKSTRGLYKSHLMKNPEMAKYVLNSFFKSNEKKLKKVKPHLKKKSLWLDYMQTNTHYSGEIFALKETFIKEVLLECNPNSVLDIGCNTGHFSLLCAKENKKVVAIDLDRASIDALYVKAKKEKKDILPLVGNVCRPTPALGWNNKETKSFLERAHNKFDLVLMLAVIHHMLITERVPLFEIASLASNLTRRFLVVEFVEKNDPMFQLLVRGRDDLYNHLTLDNFKKAFSDRFVIRKEKRLKDSHRILFLLEKKE